MPAAPIPPRGSNSTGFPQGSGLGGVSLVRVHGSTIERPSLVLEIGLRAVQTFQNIAAAVHRIAWNH